MLVCLVTTGCESLTPARLVPLLGVLMLPLLVLVLMLLLLLLLLPLMLPLPLFCAGILPAMGPCCCDDGGTPPDGCCCCCCWLGTCPGCCPDIGIPIACGAPPTCAAAVAASCAAAAAAMSAGAGPLTNVLRVAVYVSDVITYESSAVAASVLLLRPVIVLLLLSVVVLFCCDAAAESCRSKLNSSKQPARRECQVAQRQAHGIVGAMQIA
jgi:hypothetical protein